MGAINKKTNTYEYPFIAEKKNNYKCPDCNRDVIFKKGKIKRPHFSHYKSENPCKYYDRPNESQIHKDAKLKFKKILDNKNEIIFRRRCLECMFDPITIFEFKIFNADYNNCFSCEEKRFTYNNSKKSADVALVNNNNEIKYIFEICHTNKTKEENRPEPWFEIKAESLLNSNDDYNFECIRNYKCEMCLLYNKYQEKTKKIQDIKRRKEHELFLKKREAEKIKQEKEYNEFLKKREAERLKKEFEEKRLQKIYDDAFSKDIICKSCKINYCKCRTSAFIKNKFNQIECTNCKKLKCKCTKITNFYNHNHNSKPSVS
jgi:hypothetical protein